MPIPDYESIMKPLLEYLSDDKEHSKSEVDDFIADIFSLTEEEKEELLPSGRQRLFYSRVGWAISYLKQASLIESPKRGTYAISKLGLDVIKNALSMSDKKVKHDDLPEEVQNLIKEREQARVDKDYAKADALREEIEKMGYRVKDSADCCKVERL